MIQDIHPHLFNNEYIADSVIRNEDYVFHFKGSEILLKQNGKGLEIPKKSDLSGCSDDGIFLFTLNDTRCFLVEEYHVLPNETLKFYEIRNRNPFQEKEIDLTSGVALHLRNWYNQHKYCGKCGTPTVLKSNERAVQCPSCGAIVFPTISPAIIVAIFCNERVLLVRGVNFPEGFFSLVAGYVDVGESLESAVMREVKEEVGLNVKNIRYYKSQPWPFSGSMMIGFIADAEEGQTIAIEEAEIAEATWYGRDELPNYPHQRSIAGEIIEKFRRGESL